MTYDLVLRKCTVVDGTGKPAFRADMAIAEGRIAEIGQVVGTAAKSIDAADLVAAPGAIDVHSHYDAQVCWDGLLSNSSEHGTTTVIQGNCGIGVAPCRPTDREAALQDLIAIEGMSHDVLTSGIAWDFETFPEYLQQLQRRGLAINLGAFVPLTNLRRYTLGDDASERAATSEERKEMVENLRQAMEGGAIGFSASLVKRQVGYKGRPLACRMADEDELVAYAAVLRDLHRGVIQVNVAERPAYLMEDESRLLELLSAASGGQPVTYSGALYRNDDPGAVGRMLEQVEPLRKKGIIPQSTTRPLTNEVDFRNPFILADVPAFKRVLNKSVEEQKVFYSDPQWRDEARGQLAEGGKIFGGAWLDGVVLRVGHAAMHPYLLKSVREIAAERGRDPFDTLIDLVLEDDMQLKLLGELFNNNAEHLREHIKDPRLLIGLADGGAHVDMLFESSYPSYMLGHWVREEKAIGLEHAVARMTSEPADYFRIKDRGRLAVGMAADIMVFDPKTVGSPKKADKILNDLPGGGTRLYASATGINYVIVNGQIVYDHGAYTGATPGRIVDGR